MKKIAITGGTGLIGRALHKKLIDNSFEVVILSREPDKIESKILTNTEYKKWNPFEIFSIEKSLNGIDAFVHLAGESIAEKRWTEEQKKKIIESRILSTKNIVEAISKAENKPKVFIHASAIGYYGYSESEIFDENSKNGDGFLAKLANEWESISAVVENYGIRRVSMRIGIVLSAEGGVLKKFILPFKLFGGMVLGSGKQWMSWIHIDDLVNLFYFALTNEKVQGPINAVSPDPITMKEFSSLLAKRLNRPCWFNVPEKLLKLFLGEMSEIITKGQRVIPERAFSYGFKFEFNSLDSALNNILKSSLRK
ncbi:MAG: TIGR01777 family oxidoreductase [Ignavibacteria bacterium]|nr:TIGR01777 family oxidoreductase [Ignavibacteria bacterium]